MYNIITEIDILMYNFHNESSRLESYFNQVEARYGIIMSMVSILCVILESIE